MRKITYKLVFTYNKLIIMCLSTHSTRKVYINKENYFDNNFIDFIFGYIIHIVLLYVYPLWFVLNRLVTVESFCYSQQFYEFNKISFYS